jgi:hypothetical protein
MNQFEQLEIFGAAQSSRATRKSRAEKDRRYEENSRGPRAQFNISLTPPELKELNAAIAKHGLSKVEFIRGAAHLLEKGLFEEIFNND